MQFLSVGLLVWVPSTQSQDCSSVHLSLPLDPDMSWLRNIVSIMCPFGGSVCLSFADAEALLLKSSFYLFLLLSQTEIGLLGPRNIF